MTNLSLDDIRSLLRQGFEAQQTVVAEWHRQEPGFPADLPPIEECPGFLDTLLRQHWCNFRLWHVEDRARRKDAGAELIADCKYAIDKLNQERNDLIERLDIHLVRAFDACLPAAPQGVRVRCNSETMGGALDRGSTLALKIYHMREQAERLGVAPEFVVECQRKLTVLNEQRDDLFQAVCDLVDDYAVGLKRPKVYYHFKMYNDPRLNPELYTRKTGA